MNTYEFYCALHGHFTLGPTGESMRCLRCGVTLDGLGLDARLSRSLGVDATGGES